MCDNSDQAWGTSGGDIRQKPYPPGGVVVASVQTQTFWNGPSHCHGEECPGGGKVLFLTTSLKDKLKGPQRSCADSWISSAL